MGKEYQTAEIHKSTMENLFPNGIKNATINIGNDELLKLHIAPGVFENTGGLQVELLYDKSFFPESITDKLANIESYMACKIGMFFHGEEIIISSIQGQSFSDKLANIFLTFNATAKTKQEFDKLLEDYPQQKDHIMKGLVKKIGMPPADFLFLLASLLGLSLGGKKVTFLKKDVIGSIYSKQNKPWDQKLKEKFNLQEGEDSVFWSEDQIISFIGNMPIAQRDVLFNFFDSLGDYRNKEDEQSFTDIANRTKGELIGSIRDQRRNLLGAGK